MSFLSLKNLLKIYLFWTTLNLEAAVATEVLLGEKKTFACNILDIPVLWDFKSAKTGSHSTLGFLDSSGRYYVPDSEKYRLESASQGTQLTVLQVSLADEGTYTCKKFYNQDVTRMFAVEVTAPPKSLRISQEHPAEEGELYTLDCVTERVKPIPRISWQMKFSNGSQVDMTSQSVINVFPNEDMSSRVVSSVGVHLTRSVQGSSFICLVELQTSQLGTVYTNSLAAHTTNAFFKPLAPLLYGLDENLVGNRLYTLRCIAGYANPPAIISWHKDGIRWSATKTDVSSFIGFFVTSSYLEINATHLVDNSVFECRVTSPLMLRDGDPPFLEQKIAHVQYAPIIGAWINNKTIDEGEMFELDCAVKFSKPIANIRWLRDDSPIDLTSDRYIVYPYPSTKWTSLTVQSSTWRDTGTWRCEAYNSLGIVTSKPIYVDIKHKPYCVHNTTLLKSSLGQTTTLTCSVRSNPNSNVTINWFANDQVFAANMKADMGNNHIAYHIINIETRSVSDYGTFYCSAMNSVGETPWRCEIQLMTADETKKDGTAASALLAAFGGGTQSYVIASCLGIVIVALVVFVIIIIIVKTKKVRKKKSAQELTTIEMSNPEICTVSGRNASSFTLDDSTSNATDSSHTAQCLDVKKFAPDENNQSESTIGSDTPTEHHHGSSSSSSSSSISGFTKAKEGTPEYLLHEELKSVVATKAYLV